MGQIYKGNQLILEGGGGVTPITVDSALSTTSENPVQNKVITNALNDKADKTELDDYYKKTETYNKTEVNTLLDDKQDKLTAGNNIQITGTTISATDTIYTAGKGIEIKNGKDYSAMQGPCPEGFHVPLNTEWQAVYNIWTALGGGSSDGTNFGIALKLPFAGTRNSTNANALNQGTFGNYWSPLRQNTNSVYILSFSSTALNPQASSGRTYGRSVRCFKDTPVVPDNTWIKLYGTSIEAGGIFWSSTDGLISMSSDGITWITIADKNLGATTVWNSGDTLSETNCGKYYQWGNNYGFPRTGTIANQSTTQVDASNYGPGNYYSSDTFIKNASFWDSSGNDNLRGGVTGVVQLHNAISITETAMDSKQDALVSGDNIKTINGIDILGSGDISMPPLGNLEFLFWLGDGSSPASGTYDISGYSWVYMIGSNGSNGWTYPYFFPTSMMTGGRSFGSFQPGYNNYWQVQGNSLSSLTFSTPKGQFIHVYGVV